MLTNEELFEKFEAFTHKNGLPGRAGHLLLALSGGRDSMFMAWLFLRLGYQPAIAHCNFKLRDEESDADEQFVKDWSSAAGLVFHSTQFETAQYARTRGISIQMAARELRYRWFDELTRQYGYEYIAIGQHLGDNTETVLINLVRGTGIRGLHGILPRKHKLIRPLLFLDRSEIDFLCKLNQIHFREDRSNTSTHYLRNMLRLEVIPALKKRNPALDTGIYQSTARIRTAERFYLEKLSELEDKIITREGRSILFSRYELKALGEDAATVLDEWLRPFGFSYQLSLAIASNLEAQSGIIYHSSSHELAFEALHLHLRPHSVSKRETAFKKSFSFELIRYRDLACTFPAFPHANDAGFAYLDAEKLNFPLEARTWLSGDQIIPLGMSGHKKLSDLFTNFKISRSRKDEIPLAISAGTIVWVGGLKIHDSFKCTAETRWVCRLSLKSTGADLQTDKT